MSAVTINIANLALHLTDADRRGLTVIARAPHHTAHRSNITEPRRHQIYWQTVQRLTQHQLIREHREHGQGRWLELTELGTEVWGTLLEHAR